MAYTTRTVQLEGKEWTFITNKVAMLQFNDRIQMTINSGEIPDSTQKGFVMALYEKYVNNDNGITVWAKRMPGGTNSESVTVLENGV